MITNIIINIVLFILGLVIGSYSMRLRWMMSDPDTFTTTKTERRLTNKLNKPRGRVEVFGDITEDEYQEMEEGSRAEFEAKLREDGQKTS